MQGYLLFFIGEQAILRIFSKSRNMMQPFEPFVRRMLRYRTDGPLLLAFPRLSRSFPTGPGARYTVDPISFHFESYGKVSITPVMTIFTFTVALAL